MTNEFLPSTAQVLPEEQRGLRPARRAAATLGVLAIGIVAVVGIVTWAAGRGDPDAADALFVLPVPTGDWQLSDAALIEPVPDPDVPATDERFIADGNLYGIEDGDGFGRVRALVRYPESPLPGARWEPATTPVDGGWRVVSSPSDLVHVYDLLVNDTNGLVLLAVFEPTVAPGTPMTSFAMTSPDGSTFVVETAVGSPLFDVATHAERIESVDVSGVAGWIVEGSEGGATSVVTWAPETGRTVSVRSTDAQDTVVDVARQLEVVSADEWTSSFPAPAGD